ncbi:MAG: iron-containing alcohol dehydrogenase [Bacteroidaceae bacterium]|nr:iron-containing alcohol dehydrogenase [Bacteroidaceae bacterium]
MENFTFCSPTEFVFGRDTEKEVGQLCCKHGASRVLIIYGGGSVVRSGLLQRVEQSLTTAGLSYETLGGVKPNPEDGLVREGIRKIQNMSASAPVFLLAVGGGSVIDTAKAIACGACYDGDFWDFYIGKAKIQRALPVGVVLTIPAAGSEGSGNSVITNTATGQKISLRSPEHLRPVFSIMNPELTYTLPPYQTASGICDMMVHIFERYFTNTPETNITDHLAEGVLRSIIEQAPLVMQHPQDYGARANIMWAGMLAHNGLCGTGHVEDWASHFMEHELSALYGVTHGAGLAVVFPAWLTVVSRSNPKKAVQLAVRVFDVPYEGRHEQEIIAEGIARLRHFWTSLGLPSNMRELGITDPDIDLLVHNLHETKGEPIGNYVRLDRILTREIYDHTR